MHFALLAGFGLWEDIGPFRYPSVAGALEALARVVAEAAPGEWVAARQFDPSLQEGPPELTTRELDRISTSHPLFVLNASGHIAYVNSRALELAGITAETPDPPGGAFGRDAEGRPNGVLKAQSAFGQVLIRAPQLLERLQAGFIESGIAVSAQASALGITTLCDQATGGLAGMRDLEAYRAMFASGRMKTRVRASLFWRSAPAWDAAGVRFGEGDAWLRVVGWKIVSDGSNQGFTGYQREPYLGSESRGMLYVEADDLRQMVVERARQGWPVVIHGNGDAAIDNILDAVEAAAEAGVHVKPLRIRIEHCSILHDDQIARIAALGISPSFLINHVHYWGQTLRDDVFGEKKVQLLDRCASVERAGITWTIHSDAPVSELGPLRKIETAVVRNLWREPGTILAREERVPVETAIRAVTSYAAWQCHSEAEIGSLEPGKLADLVVLARDPRKVAPTAIHEIPVRETWLDGARVYAA
jgi:predicted amidohydrolase YtcJ